MDNLEIIKQYLKDEKLAKELLNKLSFNIEIISPSDKILTAEQTASNCIKINVKGFISEEKNKKVTFPG